MQVRWILLIIFLAVIGGIIYAVFHYRDRIEILREFVEFLRERKLWWITPIVVILLLLGVIIVVFETGAVSTVIYTIF